MTRAQLKQLAKEQLAGQWFKVGFSLLGISLIFGLIGYIPILGFILVLLLAGAIELGVTEYSLRIAKGEKAQFGILFNGFNNFGKALGLMLLQGLLILLWSLLLIIPGIIKAYSYSMAFYILAENPEMGIYECLKESSRMTNGYKFDLFVLELSFLGWNLLGSVAIMMSTIIMTTGILEGGLFIALLGGVLVTATIVATIALLSPYILQTYTNMYNQIK